MEYAGVLARRSAKSKGVFPMAKRKAIASQAGMAKKGGPYLAAAFFCESTIEDKQDGAISAIRIVDKLTLTIDAAAPPDVPSKEKRVPVRVAMFVSFKTGHAPGSHTIRLVLRGPSGKKTPVREDTLLFAEQPNSGVNIRMIGTIGIATAGLYWMDVLLDGRRLTRMPLEIEIQRAQVPETAMAESPPK
jgi:hypothetical protein